MIVLERTSSIGILRALGANKIQIIKIFLIQGITLSLIGIVIGNLLAFGLSYLQIRFDLISLPADIYFISSVPISIDIVNYIIVSASAFILSILAAIIPCTIAAGFSPIASIKFS
jgi:lipoprotein-releasing system permease protein